MSIRRGDIFLARFPHASGGRGKRRPVVVVQSDVCNSHLRHFIVAEITTDWGTPIDPSGFAIDIATPEGKATGLDRNSIVSGLHLNIMSLERLGASIGSLSATMLKQLEVCLKMALQIP